MPEKMKILVVEHDEEARSGLSNDLSGAGYTVIEAADGAEALTLYSTEKPDLVVLDIAITGINGFEVCRRIKLESPTGVPVIIATAKENVAGRLKGFQGGADDYITKPYDLNELNARIKVMRRLSHPWFEFKENDVPPTVGTEALFESLEEMILS